MKPVNITKINLSPYIDIYSLNKVKISKAVRSISMSFIKDEKGEMSNIAKSRFALKIQNIAKRPNFLGYTYEPYFIDLRFDLKSNKAAAFFFYENKTSK